MHYGGSDLSNRLTGTKGRILDLLKKNPKLSAAEFADYLHMTEMGVRKHLNTLIQDGFIDVENSKQAVGRPVQFFSLNPKSDELFPKNYGEMTVHFLSDIEESFGKEAIEKLFLNRKIRLLDEYQSHVIDRYDHEEKTSKLNVIQNTKGYMSQLEKMSEGSYVLTEYNCPIMEVARNFPIACARETELIKDFLGADHVERTVCRAEGGAYCRFVIRFNQPSATRS